MTIPSITDVVVKADQDGLQDPVATITAEDSGPWAWHMEFLGFRVLEWEEFVEIYGVNPNDLNVPHHNVTA